MWFSLMLWLACDGGGESGPKDSDPPQSCSATASVEIGDGLDPFNPIADGSAVTMVHGPQGGWHVLAGVQVTNTDEIISIHYSIDLLPEEIAISDNNYRVQLRQDGDCKGSYWNMYGYLDVTPLKDGEMDTPPELLCNRTLRMTIAVEDGEGKGAEASMEILAAVDPKDSCGPS